MRIVKEVKTVADSRINGFGQVVTRWDDYEYTTVYGSLAEAIEYSHAHSCYLLRSVETEHLFPCWDSTSKYVELFNGEASMFADRVQQLNGAGWYTHKFVIEEAAND